MFFPWVAASANRTFWCSVISFSRRSAMVSLWAGRSAPESGPEDRAQAISQNLTGKDIERQVLVENDVRRAFKKSSQPEASKATIIAQFAFETVPPRL